MAVTIQDVAKAASVSVATVSRVVNNIPLVSEDTKQRVLAAIDELGYEPNEVARSLKVRKQKRSAFFWMILRNRNIRRFLAG